MEVEKGRFLQLAMLLVWFLKLYFFSSMTYPLETHAWFNERQV